MRAMLAVALISALLGACSFHSNTTVEHPAPAAAVVVPESPPPTTVVMTPG